MLFNFLSASTGIVTADMLKGVTDTVNGNINVILPVGVGVMATLIGVGIIPKIIHKFI